MGTKSRANSASEEAFNVGNHEPVSDICLFGSNHKIWTRECIKYAVLPFPDATSLLDNDR